MTIPKLLAQSAPVATTLTTLYTVPGCTCTSIHTLVICNRAAIATTFRIACAPKGAADAVAHYLYYDYAIGGNATVLLNELGLKLTATDELRIYAGANTLCFSAFGTEAL
jgi:hypothetical protein